MKHVYVIGGAGYIGSHVVRSLRLNSAFPEVIDLGIHGNVEAPQDVRDMDPPDVPGVVLWLASQHLEPAFLAENEKIEWQRYACDMEDAVENWKAAGHDMVYASSMQVVARPLSIYSRHKLEIERILLGKNGSVSIRLGTVYGGLNRDPCRPHTLPNRLLLETALSGKWARMREDVSTPMYWTTLGRAVGTLTGACLDPFSRTGQVVDASQCVDYTSPGRHFNSEDFSISAARVAVLRSLPHPTKLLAEKVGLPYPCPKQD